MRTSLLDLLADPVSRAPLDLESGGPANGSQQMWEGTLRSRDRRAYPIVRGIPRFVLTEDGGQLQSAESFGFKWNRLDTYDSPRSREVGLNWLLKRHGFKDVQAMRRHFDGRRCILDAGCGSGFSASLWLEQTETTWVGMDISNAVDVAQKRMGHLENTHFVQGDILQPPLRNGSFDAICSEGVLHHTPSTAQALRSLAPLLKPDGEFLFYIYRKKAPVREFTDDHIRDAISGLAPAEAWETLRSLTMLGKVLSDLRAEIEVPEDIPYLGIKAGRHDVQRLIYWHFAKLYWNDALTFDENHHINFDWYHPRYAHRHTEEEIRSWCDECGLDITWFAAEESGFTVRARKV